MAKKRHHQSVRSRENEAAGMAKAMASKHYGYPMAASHMKERNPSMISDDRSAPCNLPEHVMDKYWPASHDYNMGYVPTLFNGVDKQLREDSADMRKAFGPKKY